MAEVGPAGLVQACGLTAQQCEAGGQAADKSLAAYPLRAKSMLCLHCLLNIKVGDAWNRLQENPSKTTEENRANNSKFTQML